MFNSIIRPLSLILYFVPKLSLILYDPILASFPLHMHAVLSRLLRIAVDFGEPNCFHWNFVTQEILEDLENGEFPLPPYITGTYVIVNTLTGQFYVGMSQYDLTRRLKNHLVDGEWTNWKLAEALEFWGDANFAVACWTRPYDSDINHEDYALDLEWQIVSTHISKSNLMYNIVIPWRDKEDYHHYSVVKEGSCEWTIHCDDAYNFPALQKTLQANGYNSALIWPSGPGIHTYSKEGERPFIVYTY